MTRANRHGQLGTFTGTGAGAWVAMPKGGNSFQAVSDGSHTGTTTIDIEVSNDGVNAMTTELGTISVTGNSDSDGFPELADYNYVRANCTAHGDSTNAVVVTMGG